jgi:hypothetical protein
MKNEEPEEKFKTFDYGSMTYGDTEKVRKVINNNPDKSFLELGAEIIKLLTNEDISQRPFSEVIGNIGFFLRQWILSTSNIANSTKVAETKKASGQELKDSTSSEASVLTLN